MFFYNYFYNNNNKKNFYGWKKPVNNNNNMFSYYIHEELYFLDNIKHVDLRDKCPPIYNQGELGSCTANAIDAAFEFDEMNQYTDSKTYIPLK